MFHNADEFHALYPQQRAVPRNIARRGWKTATTVEAVRRRITVRAEAA